MVSNSISRFMKDTSGVTSIEYGLIAAIVAVGIVVSLPLLGHNLKA
jgi:pilus assembly protein Flp/PilA